MKSCRSLSHSSVSSSSILHLPIELHLLIISELLWPDILALKHAHPYLYHTIPTTVCQRVDWFLFRASHGLTLPREQVDMNTDADFCRSQEIRNFLQRWYWHVDCDLVGNRCLVMERGGCPVDLAGIRDIRSITQTRSRFRRWAKRSLRHFFDR
jgi:hypothetical protein